MTAEPVIGRMEYAIIHIAAKEVGLDDETYRDLLQGMFGVRTSKGLTARQFRQLMDRFLSLGFRWERYRRKRGGGRRPVSAKESASPALSGRFVRPPAASWDREPMLTKIAAILGDLGKGWPYADAVARRMFGVDACRWLAPEQLRGVVAAMERRRRKVREGERRPRVASPSL